MRTVRLFGPILLSTALLAQGGGLAPLTEAMERLTHRLGLDGTALAVLRDGSELHCSEHGKLGRQSVIPIASASKWLAVATVLTLVDEGTLDLDVPVARYLEEFDRSDKDNVTLRQCLSCTAGFAARPGRMKGWDTKRFVEETADASLRSGPGERFVYSGIGFQVAAAAAERVTGKTFHDLFRERIAGPLGMAETRFGTLLPVAGEPGTASLPWVAGGAVSCLDDYAKFVGMLLADGRVADKRVLSEASIEQMFRDQILDQVEVRGEELEGEVRYGLGTWIVTLADGGKRVTDPGAFGFTPWIDLDLGIGGVFAVRDRVRRVLPHLAGLQERVRELALSPLVAGTDETVTFGHGGRERRYHLHVPARLVGDQGAPLVIVLHGGGGNGPLVAETTDFTALADREGFVVAYPDGTGPLRRRLLTWNSGGIPVYASQHDVDDTGFLREVVVDIQRRGKIDPQRIYAVGHSNGGMMCHRLAREASDVFAGIAVVAGAMNFTAADSPAPIGVLIVHGTADVHVRYEGGAPDKAAGRAADRVDASVQAAVDYYVQRNGLDGSSESKTDPENPGVKVDYYAMTKAGKPSWTPVRVVTLESGGHAWPGSTALVSPGVDRPFTYDATRAIWDFFRCVRKKSAGGSPAVPR